MSAVHTTVLVMVGLGAVLLVAAATLTIARMARGPSSLDRVVAADVLVAVVVATLAAEAVVNDHSTTLPVMLVLALLGFAGAVSIARFVAERDLAQPHSAQPHSAQPHSAQPDLTERRRDSDRPDGGQP